LQHEINYISNQSLNCLFSQHFTQSIRYLQYGVPGIVYIGGLIRCLIFTSDWVTIQFQSIPD